MKLPLDLGTKLFFRLILPGFIFAIGTLPVLVVALSQMGLVSYVEVGFVALVFLGGWLVIVSDLPIYMLFEGRRYWPHWLTRVFLQLEQRRLRKLEKIIADNENLDTPEARWKYYEAVDDLSGFPVGPDGKCCVEYPTRLGNIIASFEGYSDSRYGFDAIFFWPRIWVNLDKELRDEIDSQQSIADSPVYISAIFLVIGVIWLFFSLCVLFRPVDIGYLENASVLFSRYLPSGAGRWTVTMVCFGAAYILYKVSCFSNKQFGETFKAVMDRSVIHFEELVPQELILEALPKDLTGTAWWRLKGRRKFEAVRRFLQYRRVRCEKCRATIAIESVHVHVCEAADGGDDG